MLRLNGVMPFEAKLLFSEKHSPRHGSVDASDLYHPRLVQVIDKLGHDLPRRTTSVAVRVGVGDIAVMRVLVEATGKQRDASPSLVGAAKRDALNHIYDGPHRRDAEV